DERTAPRGREARLAVVVGVQAARAVMGEAANLAGEGVEGDDFLAVGVPGGDVAIGVGGAAIEAVAAVLGGDEGPVLEGAAGNGGDVAEVGPGGEGEEEFVVGEGLLLGLVEADGVVGD